MTTYPESKEVIEQTVRRLHRLLKRVHEDESAREALEAEIVTVTTDYSRAGRVAALLAEKVTANVKRELGPSAAGIQFEFDHEPEEFELTCLAYLNQAISNDWKAANETFAQMVATEPEESIQGFMLILVNIFGVGA